MRGVDLESASGIWRGTPSLLPRPRRFGVRGVGSTAARGVSGLHQWDHGCGITGCHSSVRPRRSEKREEFVMAAETLEHTGIESLDWCPDADVFDAYVDTHVAAPVAAPLTAQRTSAPRRALAFARRH